MSEINNEPTIPLLDAINLTGLGYSSISDLDPIFTAIQHLTDHPHLVKDLAKIGSYLVDDWGNTLGDEYKSLKDKMKESKQ